MGGEAHGNEASDGRGVFLGFKTEVGAELVGGIPEALPPQSAGDVLFRCGNPEHGVGQSLLG